MPRLYMVQICCWHRWEWPDSNLTLVYDLSRSAPHIQCCCQQFSLAIHIFLLRATSLRWCGLQAGVERYLAYLLCHPGRHWGIPHVYIVCVSQWSWCLTLCALRPHVYITIFTNMAFSPNNIISLSFAFHIPVLKCLMLDYSLRHRIQINYKIYLNL